MAFLGLDAEFRVTYMNARAEALFDAAHAEFEGRVLWEAVPSLAGTALEPELAVSMRDQEEANLEGEAPLAGERTTLRLHAYPSDDESACSWRTSPGR